MATLEVVYTEHTNDIDNPHQVTKTQVGLGNVPNYSVASQNEAEQGLSNERLMTPLRAQQLLQKVVTEQLDVRYIRIGEAVNSSIKVEYNPTRIFIFADGAWRQVWPAQWTL
jgi:hypothetical protein